MKMQQYNTDSTDVTSNLCVYVITHENVKCFKDQSASIAFISSVFYFNSRNNSRTLQNSIESDKNKLKFTPILYLYVKF